ncbi:MAG: hypothetical protein LBS10_07690 [Gracilibacteraceae bacterium]|jgi:hypothetical protein|nr:hypothetical protein [Gracilibacteraceae bacterium]
MFSSSPFARQPWRGLMGTAFIVFIALVISSSQNMDTFGGIFTLLTMSFIPMLAVICNVWHTQFPSTENIKQPWKGLLLLFFIIIYGILVTYAIRNFMCGGVPQPVGNLYATMVVMTMFFFVVAFDTWPYQKMPLPARGFLTLVTVYVLAWIFLRLFNFSMLSYPTGVNPSPGAVPFYAPGGPFEAFASIAPTGPLPWEMAVAFIMWAVIIMWSLVMLGMWPFSKFKLPQPLFGLAVLATCLALSFVLYKIVVDTLHVEPLMWLNYGVCYCFGIFMIMMMLQMWPGRLVSPVLGGALNLLLCVGIGALANKLVWAFCYWHFGETMAYPNGVFAAAGVMLGLSFPMWGAYGDLFEFWPMPAPAGAEPVASEAEATE